MNYSDYQYTYSEGSETIQVFTGKGQLHAIVVGETAAGTIGIIDGTSGSTVNVATLEASIPEGTYEFNCSIAEGLRIIAGAGSKFTVMWSKS